MEQGQKPATGRKALLISGIASSLLYVAMNIVSATLYPGYSSISQTISELSAIGAPTKPLWDPFVVIYVLLMIAFAIGVRASAKGKRGLRVSGSLLMVSGVIGLAFPFASMNRREVLAAGGGTLSDTMHLVLGSVTVPLWILAIGFAAKAFGTRFRRFSIGTLAVLLASGALAGMEGPKIAANLPTPLVGVWERLSFASFLLWVIVMAVMLLRDSGNRARLPRPIKAGNGMNISG